ncbi:hypothetical protein ACFFX0_23385 [Citricoccus parietis]|uniref:Uncharacterized protein n=1 Tax=Citricoccus parietis TaxID=592307 RepID=A0ABV5G504_9MICC
MAGRVERQRFSIDPDGHPVSLRVGVHVAQDLVTAPGILWCRAVAVEHTPQFGR